VRCRMQCNARCDVVESLRSKQTECCGVSVLVMVWNSGGPLRVEGRTIRKGQPRRKVNLFWVRVSTCLIGCPRVFLCRTWQ
jgi:hypothetical protein